MGELHRCWLNHSLHPGKYLQYFIIKSNKKFWAHKISILYGITIIGNKKTNHSHKVNSDPSVKEQWVGPINTAHSWVVHSWIRDQFWMPFMWATMCSCGSYLGIIGQYVAFEHSRDNWSTQRFNPQLWLISLIISETELTLVNVYMLHDVFYCVMFISIYIHIKVIYHQMTILICIPWKLFNICLPSEEDL